MTLLVGKQAPDFSVKAVVKQEIIDEFTLSQFKGSYVILFFYPLDFTFVCPTELHAFQDAYDAFKARGAQLVACSVDSCYAHSAWLATPPKLGGIQGVTYPIIADINKTVAADYGVLCESQGIAYRGLFLIDRAGVVRHQLVNDLPLGRSVYEALRILDALRAFEEHGETCPANWQQGEQQLAATAEATRSYLSETIDL